MAKTQKIRVNTIEALAAAIVAFRNFNQRIVRDIPENNKMSMLAHFTGFKQLNITDNDRAEAETIRLAFSQRVMMLGLTGQQVSSFLADINSICQNEEVSSEKFGVLAWAPKLYSDIVKHDDVRETILGLAINSAYIGKEGHKVNINYVPIDSRYLKNYNSWIHYGHDSHGNIVYFWRSQRLDYPCQITARVKAHRRDERHSNAIMTVLNYVKEVDEK